MRTNIIINLVVEGFHYWEDAKTILPEVSFLSDNHRHMFHICCKKQVTHDDRDVEIILFKRKVSEYLQRKYGKFQHNCFQYLQFNGMSCEMIARELLDKFELSYVSVLEDGENGGEIYN